MHVVTLYMCIICFFVRFRLGILILSNMVLYHHLMSYRSPISTYADTNQPQYRYVNNYKYSVHVHVYPQCHVIVLLHYTGGPSCRHL